MTDGEDPVLRPHSGTWEYHDDDCLCGSYTSAWCNRGGRVWSCCGACKEHSDCSAPKMHPTFWKHPSAGATHAGYQDNWPVYRTNAEIRAAVPGAFEPEG